MAAVDTPPGLGLPGTPVGWFRSRPGPRKFATRGFVVVLVVGIAAIALSRRQLPPWQLGPRLIVVTTAILIAAVALAVRRARVGLARDGVRWGWGALTVRMAADRIRAVRLYRDAIALVPKGRGSTWFLSRRDWDRFEAMRRAALSHYPCEDLDRDAPWRARLQSYGRFVDGLVIAAALAVVWVALLALG